MSEEKLFALQKEFNSNKISEDRANWLLEKNLRIDKDQEFLEPTSVNLKGYK